MGFSAITMHDIAALGANSEHRIDDLKCEGMRLA